METHTDYQLSSLIHLIQFFVSFNRSLQVLTGIAHGLPKSTCIHSISLDVASYNLILVRDDSDHSSSVIDQHRWVRDIRLQSGQSHAVNAHTAIVGAAEAIAVASAYN